MAGRNVDLPNSIHVEVIYMNHVTCTFLEIEIY